MSGEKSGGGFEDSFNAHTWLRPAPVKKSESEDPDFDVRNWTRDAAGTPSTDTAHKHVLKNPLLIAVAGIGLGTAALAVIVAVRANGPGVAASPTSTSSAAPVVSSRRTLTLSDPAQLPRALRAAGAEARQAEEAASRVRATVGPARGEIRLVFDLLGPQGAASIRRLEATRVDGSGISLSRRGGTFAEERLDASLTSEIRIARGEMDSKSFYTSAVSAGVLDNLIGDFTNAFSFDFDMQREIGPGDTFEAGYELRLNPAGEPVGAPRLLYASLTTAAKSRTLYRFQAPGDSHPGWYDANGRSTVRALIRTPLDVARITSGFGYRLHPIDGYRKLHRGTDFAAPIGTPIFAAGDATVEVAEPHGAAGNFVVLKHDNGWETRYMHLSRFAPGLVHGARVAQGQPIGEVGTTGHSTGPHLHFEVWIKGEPVDSQTIDTGAGRTLTRDAMKAFLIERDRIDDARAKQAPR